MSSLPAPSAPGARALYEALVPRLSAAALLLDAQGEVLAANAAVARLLGVPVESVRGSLLAFIARFGVRTPDGQPAGNDAFLRARGGEPVLGLERRLRDARGAEHALWLSLFPLHGAGGHVEAVLVLAEEVRASDSPERPLGAGARLLFEASAALVESLDAEGTLRQVVRLAVPLFADLAFADVMGEDGQVRRLELAYADPADARAAEVLRRYAGRTDEPAPLAEVLRTGEPRLFPDAVAAGLAGAQNAEHAEAIRASGATALIHAPLVARGRRLGTLSFVLGRSGRRYGPDDLLLAGDLARRAALAVDNARLVAEARAARAQAERAHAHAQRLQSLTAALSGAATLEQVTRVMVDEGREALGAHLGTVAVLTPDGRALSLTGAQGLPGPVRERLQHLPLELHTPPTVAARTGAPVWLPDLDAFARDFPDLLDDLVASTGTQAALAVPLLAGHRCLGVLSFAFPTPHALGVDERDFVLALASHCAEALERARLYEAERAARAREQRLQAVTSALSEAATTVDVARVALAQAAQALGAHTGSALLLSRDGRALEPSCVAGGPPELAARFGRIPLETRMPATTAARTGAPLWLEDPEALEREAPGLAATLAPHLPVRALVALPLAAHGRTLGALTFTFDRPVSFERADRAFALVLAQQCGLALERARLFEAERRARERARQLQAVTAALARALTLDEVLQVAVEQGREALGAYMGVVVRVDAPRAELELVAGVGVDPTLRERYHRFPLAAPMPIADAVRSGEPVWLHDRGEFARRYPAAERATADRTPHGAALTAVPLSARGRTFGALGMSFLEPQPFDEEDRSFVLALAGHCAEALERAGFYEAEHRRREREERLQAVTARLSVAATPDEVVRVVVEEGGEVLGANAGMLAVLSEDGRALVPLAEVGMDPALVERYATIPLDLPAPVPAAVRTGEPLFLPSREVIAAEFRAFAEEAEGLMPLGAAAVLPLRSGGHTVGALALSFDEPRAFAVEERSFALALAQACVDALERARLYAATERARAQAEAANARAEESLARLDALFTAAPLGHALYDLDLRYVRVNPWLAELHGRSPEQHVGHTLPEVVGAEHAAGLVEHLTRVRDTGEPLHDLPRTRRHAGTGAVLDLLVSYYPVRRADGQLVGVGASVLDVTERTRAEQERRRLTAQLEAERARLAAVLEQLPAGVLIAEAPGGRIVAGNRAAEAIMRGPLPPVERAEDYVLYRGVRPEDGRPLALEEYALYRAVRLGEVVPDEPVDFLRHDGERATLSVAATPVRDPGGRVQAAVLTFHDVTDERRRATGQRFLAEASRALSASLDFHATLARTSELPLPLLGDWAAVSLVQPTGSEHHLHVPDPALAPLADAARREARRGALVGGSLEVVLRTGHSALNQEVDLARARAHAAGPAHAALLERMGVRRLLVVPLPAGGGRLVGALALMRGPHGAPFRPDEVALAEEFGRRAALALENARLYQDTQLALQARQDLVSFVSHDLATPLLAMDTTIALLGRELDDEGPKAERAAAQLGWMAQSVAGMRRLVGELLELGRLEAGQIPLRRARHTVAALVDPSLATVRPLADGRGVRLVGPQGAEDVEVECDAERMRQVLTNLVGNAVRFSPPGGQVQVRVALAPDRVRFGVIDQGPGIPAEELPRVFGRFWQGSSRTNHEGAGLGLYIAKVLVERHGGSLWVESEPGHGAVFLFTLPR